jgi:hypothetical protein
MCSFSHSKPPGRQAKRGYRLSVPIVNILQHIANWLAGQINFFGFPRVAVGGLVRLFSFEARLKRPPPPALQRPSIPFRRTGSGVCCEAPVTEHRYRPRSSPGRHAQPALEKNRTLFIVTAIKVLQRKQTQSSPCRVAALLRLGRKGPRRRPGHGPGCAGPGSGHRGRSVRSRGLACPRCGTGGRPSGSTCRRPARRRPGSR